MIDIIIEKIICPDISYSKISWDKTLTDYIVKKWERWKKELLKRTNNLGKVVLEMIDIQLKHAYNLGLCLHH